MRLTKLGTNEGEAQIWKLANREINSFWREMAELGLPVPEGRGPARSINRSASGSSSRLALRGQQQLAHIYQPTGRELDVLVRYQAHGVMRSIKDGHLLVRQRKMFPRLPTGRSRTAVRTRSPATAGNPHRQNNHYLGLRWRSQ